ncbi:MAG: MFS transporter [Desulfurococcaceae archaeon]|jgi:MFS family permease
MRLQKPLLVFVVLSTVSLLADVAYEGGRSISGQFLRYLGAPAVAAGLLAVGEFLGYALRLPVGLLISARRDSRLLWLTVVLGYSLVVAVPLLALAGQWQLALALYLVERAGKGLRSPARDVIIADITDKVLSRGLGFGIHELLDQVGALLGPLLVGYALASGMGYGPAYALLLPPAVAAAVLVALAAAMYPRVDMSRGKAEKVVLGARAKKYLVYTGLLSAGLVHWSLVSYHLKGVASESLVPLLYALAMAVDAVVSVPLGLLYDKLKLKSLLLVSLSSALVPPLVFLRSDLPLLAVGAALFGVVVCSYESVLRAAAADSAESPGERAVLFGWLGFTWGVSWAFGSVVGGVVYEYLGPAALSTFYTALSLASLAYLAGIQRRD